MNGQIDKKKVARRFSRNAKTYDQYANVQKTMAKKLLSMVPSEVTPGHILEIGCGTGYLTGLLATAYPHAQIDALDIAQGMIDVASRQVTSDKVSFHCGDAETWDGDAGYDLIISNATFQWFNTPKVTQDKLHGLLTEAGVLVYSTFGPDTFKELHDSFGAVRAQMDIKEVISPGQAFLDATACVDLLPEGRQSLTESQILPEYFPKCIDFLQAVKKIGANRASGTGERPIPGFIDQVMTHYDQAHRHGDQVKATYEALYICSAPSA